MKKINLKMSLCMAATTTSKDWGFKPVPGKGGPTRNASLEGGQRENKEGKHC